MNFTTKFFEDDWTFEKDDEISTWTENPKFSETNLDTQTENYLTTYDIKTGKRYVNIGLNKPVTCLFMCLHF